MATSNDSPRAAGTTPPGGPSNTTPPQDILSQSNELISKIEQGFDAIAMAAKQQQENKEKLQLFSKDTKDEIAKVKREVQILEKSFVAVFFVGFIAGVLSCLAVGVAYYLWRRVTVRTGSNNL